MKRLLIATGVALALLGASCSAKTSITAGNTNVTVSTNSSATGSFNTTPSNTNY